MTSDEEIIFEAALSAFRERRSNGEIAWAPEWFDLSVDLKIEAAQTAITQRELERALDAQQMSSTIHAVLARIAKSST